VPKIRIDKFATRGQRIAIIKSCSNPNLSNPRNIQSVAYIQYMRLCPKQVSNLWSRLRARARSLSKCTFYSRSPSHERSLTHPVLSLFFLPLSLSHTLFLSLSVPLFSLSFLFLLSPYRQLLSSSERLSALVMQFQRYTVASGMSALCSRLWAWNHFPGGLCTEFHAWHISIQMSIHIEPKKVSDAWKKKIPVSAMFLINHTNMQIYTVRYQMSNSNPIPWDKNNILLFFIFMYIKR